MPFLRLILLCICILTTCTTSAEGLLSMQWRIFNKILDRFDTVDYDTTYMANPSKLWGVGTKMEVFASQTNFDGDSTLNVEISPKANLKLTAQYRYLSLSISTFKFGSKRDFSFDFDMSGRVWGFDFIYDKSSKGDTPQLKDVDIKKTTIDVNAYYVLFNKKFCYSATRGGSMEQRRTAGSPLFGISYYYYDINIADTAVQSTFKIKEVEVNNGGISAGYGVNIVLGKKKQWLLHISAMPTLTFISKNRMIPTDDAADGDYKSNNEWYSSQVLIPIRSSIVFHHKHIYSSLYSFINLSNTTYGEEHTASNYDAHFSFSLGWMW